MSRRSQIVALVTFATLAGGCADHVPTAPPPAAAREPQASAALAPPGVAAVVAGGRLLLITPVGLDFGDVQAGATAPEQDVTITNVSGAPLVMSGVGGAPGGAFTATQDCQGQTLAAGASCRMHFTFAPTDAGPASATSVGTWNGQPFRIALRGRGVGPAFRISAAALDFGDVQVGANVQLPISFTNVGLAPVTFNGTGGAAGPFGGVQNCQGRTLAVGDSCQFFYTFAPTAAGVVTGSTSGTASGQPFSFRFRGKGVDPRFRITPRVLDFGQVRVGESVQLPITFTNVGLAPVLFNGSGGAAGAFGGVQNCQGRTLAVGDSCQFFYTFAPTAPGLVTGTTSGTASGQAFNFRFRGTGISAASTPSVPFRIAATSLDFGDVQVGASVQLSIDFTNISAAPVLFNGTGGAAGAFGGVQNCQGRTLNPGDSCQFLYTFSPTAAGVATGSTSGTASGQPFSFTFRGTGVGPKFRIVPTAIDFGSVQVGTGLQLPVTFTNVGLGPVLFNGTGGAAGPFGGVQNCQGRTLAVGDSCEFFYTFSPTDTSVVTGSTSGTASGQPFSFSFRGKGMAPRILVTPFALEFGDVAVGTTSPQQTVNVINNGTQPVLLNGTGGAAGLFGGVQDCQGTTLAPGARCHLFYAFSPVVPGLVTGATSGTWSGVPYALSFTGTGAGALQAMDLAPSTVSLTSTPTVSAVLLSAPGFDATAVTVANVRLLVNGAVDVAPIARAGAVVTATRDWNGDGLPDRLFSFRTGDLVAAGLTTAPAPNTLILRDGVSAPAWQAGDATLPAFVP